MNEDQSIKIRDFKSFPNDDLPRVLRSLITAKREYDAYSKELDEYEKTLIGSDPRQYTIKSGILFHVEKAVEEGHDRCIRNILAIIEKALEPQLETRL